MTIIELLKILPKNTILSFKQRDDRDFEIIAEHVEPVTHIRHHRSTMVTREVLEHVDPDVSNIFMEDIIKKGLEAMTEYLKKKHNTLYKPKELNLYLSPEMKKDLEFKKKIKDYLAKTSMINPIDKNDEYD